MGEERIPGGTHTGSLSQDTSGTPATTLTCPAVDWGILLVSLNCYEIIAHFYSFPTIITLQRLLPTATT